MGRHERKSNKAKQVVMGIVIALIMILSTFGIIIGNQTSSLSYNGYKFKLNGNQYVTKINGKEMIFYSLPSQSDFINVSSVIPNKIKEAYIVMLTFNPADKVNIQIIELVRFDLSQSLNKVILDGVLNASTDYPSLPLITCANATLKTPVIIMNMSDTPGIVDIDNCIYLNARGTEFLRMRDRLLYSYYGVIKDE
jgi:hypothetical protein